MSVVVDFLFGAFARWFGDVSGEGGGVPYLPVICGRSWSSGSLTVGAVLSAFVDEKGRGYGLGWVRGNGGESFSTALVR